MACCDTSFLCSLYVPQAHSLRAKEWYERSSTPLVVTDLVLMEFRQSVRLQTWLHRQDKIRGFTESQGQAAINALETHLRDRKLEAADCDWPAVARLTERLSAQHTARLGCRIFDILLVSATLILGEREFLTFDARQRRLAEAEGLRVPL